MADSHEKKSSILAWLLGMLAAAVVILSLGAYLVVRYLAREVQVIRTGDTVTVTTPAGELKVSKGGDETGLPEHPSAKMTEPGATVTIEAANGEEAEVTVAKYRTGEPLDQVDAWYKERLGPEFEREGTGKMERKKTVFGVEIRSDDVVFLNDKEENKQFVALRRSGAGTEIILIRISESAPQ
jgi:hypothetical protein